MVRFVMELLGVTRSEADRLRRHYWHAHGTTLAGLMQEHAMPPEQFLEDVHEAPYRVDRMLTQLRLAGALDKVAGIAFGKFTEAETRNNTFSMEQVLRERTAGLGVPVIRGLMIGHVEDQAVVPVGARARLDAGSATLTLIDPGLV